MLKCTVERRVSPCYTVDPMLLLYYYPTIIGEPNYIPRIFVLNSLFMFPQKKHLDNFPPDSMDAQNVMITIC